MLNNWGNLKGGLYRGFWSVLLKPDLEEILVVCPEI